MPVYKGTRQSVLDLHWSIELHLDGLPVASNKPGN